MEVVLTVAGIYDTAKKIYKTGKWLLDKLNPDLRNELEKYLQEVYNKVEEEFSKKYPYRLSFWQKLKIKLSGKKSFNSLELLCKTDQIPFYGSQKIIEVLTASLFLDKEPTEDELFNQAKQICQQHKEIVCTDKTLKEFISIYIDALKNDYKYQELIEPIRVKEIHKTTKKIDEKTDQIIDILQGQQTRQLQPLPKSLNIVFDSKKYVHRDELEQKLLQLLQESDRLLIRGMAGTGKTWLARWLVNELKSGYEYRLWFTIDRDSQDVWQLLIDRLSQYAEFASLTSKEVSDKKQALIDALNSLNEKGKLLLVLDNLDKQDQIHSVFPQLDTLQPTVIITSRRQIPDLDTVKVSTLSEPQAIDMFRKYYKREAETELIKDIVREVGYHALLIQIIATTLARYGKPLAEAYETVKNERLNKIPWKYRGKDHRTGQLKEEAISIYLEHLLDFEALTKEEAQVLTLLAAMNVQEPTDKGILLDLLGKWAEEPLISLAEKSFIERLEKGQSDSFAVHRLVIELTEEKLKPQLLTKDLALAVVRRLKSLFYYEDTENPLDKAKYLPFAESFLKNAEAVIKEFDQDDQKILATSYNNIASIYLAKGELDKALEYSEKALEIREQVLGENHPDTATSYNNIAMIYYQKG